MSAVRKASGLLTVRRVSVRDGGGINAMSRMRVRDASGLKLVYSSLSVSLSAESVRGYGNSTGTVTVTTPVATATPQGGAAPYTYLWERTDGGGASWSIVDDDGAATAFAIDLDAGQNEEATFHCTITDASGSTAVSAEVAARAINLGGGL